MTSHEPSSTARTGSGGVVGRLRGMRRRLLLLTGLGVAVAVKAATDAAPAAEALGRLNGYPPGYSPFDGQSDGVQGYAVGPNNAGAFGRNNDSNGVGVY